MNPTLRLMLQQVWPLFWPWLFWNLARAAEWQKRTGRDALIAVDRFGNIHFLVLGDGQAPDGLYTYEPPAAPRWEHPALGSDLPAEVRAEAAPGLSGVFRTYPGSFRGVFGLFPGSAAHVRGPP